MLRHNIQHPPHICAHCKCTFPFASGVRQHVTHSMECHDWLAINAWHAQCATGGPDPDHDMEVVSDVYNNNNVIINNIHLHDALEQCEETMNNGEGYQHEHEHKNMEKNGDKTVFPCFAEEFSVKAADVLGINMTPFKKMQTFQDASGGGAYTPFTDHEEWELGSSRM